MLSVIIPTYNRLEYLKRSVNSVLNQSYQDFELIIVDDGSNDGSSEYIQNLNNSKIKLIIQENLGVSSARNTGIKNSTQDWIAFLDSDDEWLPHKLKKQIDFIQKHPEFNFIHSNEIWVRNGIRVNPPKRFDKSNERIFERSLETCLISPSTVIVKRSLLQEHQLFDEEFIICEDYDLWLKILLTEKIGFIEESLITKYAGHEQLSTKYHAMDYWRLKSLSNLCKRSDISALQRDLIHSQAKIKGKLLIDGYLKHQNQDKAKEIEELLKAL